MQKLGKVVENEDIVFWIQKSEIIYLAQTKMKKIKSLCYQMLNNFNTTIINKNEMIS